VDLHHLLPDKAAKISDCGQQGLIAGAADSI
jgi:hypothetical protein